MSAPAARTRLLRHSHEPHRYRGSTFEIMGRAGVEQKWNVAPPSSKLLRTILHAWRTGGCPPAIALGRGEVPDLHFHRLYSAFTVINGSTSRFTLPLEARNHPYMS